MGNYALSDSDEVMSLDSSVKKAAEKFQNEIEVKFDPSVSLLDKIIFDEQNYFEELSKLDYAFPVDSGRAELTVMLETLTVNNGLLLNSVKFTENRKSGLDPIDLSQEAARAKAEATVSDSERVSLEIELSGTYGSFKNFLKNCEENARVLNIQEVGFGAQKSSAVVSQPGQEAVIFDFKIKMETYFLSV